MSTSAAQVCRQCGAGAPPEAHFCPACRAILPLRRERTDYFAFFGLPRRLGLDAADLERRFRTLSREFHPDYFYNAPGAARLASLERSSYLNDAFRTLRDPAARTEYLLEREGFALRGPEGGGQKVAQGLLQEVFALNEQLDEVRERREAGASAAELRPQLDEARAPIEARREAHTRQLEELSREWDALVDRDAPAEERRPVLEQLYARVLERNYINNLLAGIARELEQR